MFNPDVTFTPDIPEDWWKEAGMEDFVRATRAYSSCSQHVVPISEIEPPRRTEGTKCFERARMIALLREIAGGTIIFPIEVDEYENPHPTVERFSRPLCES